MAAKLHAGVQLYMLNLWQVSKHYCQENCKDGPTFYRIGRSLSGLYAVLSSFTHRKRSPRRMRSRRLYSGSFEFRHGHGSIFHNPTQPNP